MDGGTDLSGGEDRPPVPEKEGGQRFGRDTEIVQAVHNWRIIGDANRPVKENLNYGGSGRSASQPELRPRGLDSVRLRQRRDRKRKLLT